MADTELLRRYFDEVNLQHFDGFLEVPQLKWNSRLRSSAGRFYPVRRAVFLNPFGADRRPTIDVASYLLEEEGSEALIRDTVAHEMIHYWLWVRRRPYGHTDEFWQKMTSMGVSRYNPVPRLRPYKYLYQCLSCQGFFPARRKLGPLACAKCCKLHTGGRYDARFKLLMIRKLAPGEKLELPAQQIST